MGQVASRLLSSLNFVGVENNPINFGPTETLNDSGTQRNCGSSVFGTHFLMGGELFSYGEKRKCNVEKRTNEKNDAVKMDTFLFGDGLDLELLGKRALKFPYCQSKEISDTVNALHALINIRRDSVKFVKVESTRRSMLWNYRLEFIFDADVDCYIQVHFCAKEVVDGDYTQIVSKYPSIDSSEKYYFESGTGKVFDKYNFKSHRHDSKLMNYDGSAYFPVVIEIRTTKQPIQTQTTMCSIERSTDQSSALLLKPLKQKLIVDGVVYLMQEIFGIENKEINDGANSSFAADESCGECIICMGNPRDTVILPCRHLCICNGCAETLRYKLNNCPICRSPFKALLKLRTVKPITHSSGNFGSSGTGRMRHETMTLIEALNGPYQSDIKLENTVNCEGGSKKKKNEEMKIENIQASREKKFTKINPKSTRAVSSEDLSSSAARHSAQHHATLVRVESRYSQQLKMGDEAV